MLPSMVQVDHPVGSPRATVEPGVVLAILGEFDAGHGARVTLTERHIIIEMRAYEHESEVYIGIDDLLDALVEVTS
jgi:hypothetical protein